VAQSHNHFAMETMHFVCWVTCHSRLYNSCTMLYGKCHQQQSQLHIQVFKINYILTTLHSSVINDVLKQNYVPLLMAFFQTCYWLK